MLCNFITPCPILYCFHLLLHIPSILPLLPSVFFFCFSSVIPIAAYSFPMISSHTPFPILFLSLTSFKGVHLFMDDILCEKSTGLTNNCHPISFRVPLPFVQITAMLRHLAGAQLQLMWLIRSLFVPVRSLLRKTSVIKERDAWFNSPV